VGSFYVLPEHVGDEKVTILGKEAYHISRVLRHTVGEKIWVVDGMGTEYEIELERSSSHLVEGRIVKKRTGHKEPRVKVTLVQAIPKGFRMDYLVEKATELGVNRVIPVISARSQVFPDGDSKVRRWQRIALSAMKQSGRSLLPMVDRVTRLEDLLQSMPGRDLFLIALERGGNKLKEVMMEGIEKVLLLVGPEGGFAAPEVKLATEMGAVPVSLGERVLRSETAGIALLALLLYEVGDL